MGLDVKRFSGDVDDFQCPICQDIIEDPIACQNEHIFCKSCIDKWLQASSSCPVDRQPLNNSKLRQPPRFFRNCYAKLLLKCEFDIHGCSINCKTEDVVSHQNKCDFNPDVKHKCEKGCDALLSRAESAEPKQTKFKSFIEIFANYCGITHTIESNFEYNSEFQELKMIAFGNFGIVCKAIDKRNDKIFAIKKVPINKQFKEEALKEINILSKLKSDRIVKLESFWIENNYYLKSDELLKKSSPSHELFKQNNTLLLHIQMELCYKTLREIIEIMNKELNQKYSEVMTPLGYYISSELFIEIVESVDYLHKQNIIHRDLKPNNILITDGTKGLFVKVGDFGLATFHGTEEQSHTKYCGTPLYLAPEVSQTKRYDRKADIYSLGIIAPKLFNIDINESIGEKSCLETEYKNLFDLIIKMSAPQKNTRPDCEQILREKSLWALSLTQLMKSIDFKMNVKVKSIEECFHMFFIQKKLNS